ncbi:ABC transporter permease [Limnochorda pilosa]|uniref:Ribose ABC transporter permease n=1 Tax=Limnochorda pilosa TaxID=1555112 RepID=A0A0K2SKZ9_LIMPI|nr:ribose ABC transporter permease [Limnochorda pilosa]BAS27775.1 ribose ABC transporter permease [Limnochorda pilosa]
MTENRWLGWMQRYGMLAILVLLCLALGLMNERFFTPSNLLVVTRQATINGLLAAGMTLVILTGGIDLSVGSVLALAGAISAGTLASTGDVTLAVLAALGVGALVGLANGLLSAYPNLPPFIVTLASMAWARGLTLVYTDGRPILVREAAYRFIGGGYLGPMPMPVVILLVTYALLLVFLTRTRWGRLVYAIGGNEQACRLAGIPVNRVKTFVYTVSGLFAGLTGLVLTARLVSAQPTAGVAYELNAIAAVILGGTSLQGGRGTILGTLVGALIMGVLDNGLNLMNVSPFYQEVAKGLVILTAVLLDWALHRAGSLGLRSRAGEAAAIAPPNEEALSRRGPTP